MLGYHAQYRPIDVTALHVVIAIPIVTLESCDVTGTSVGNTAYSKFAVRHVSYQIPTWQLDQFRAKLDQ